MTTNPLTGRTKGRLLPKLGACEASGCDEDAVAFNDDGEALCEDCLLEWCQEQGRDRSEFD